MLVFIVLLLFSCIVNNTQAAKQLFVNNVSTTLAADITTTNQTSMVITSATGFPTITGTDWLLSTLVDSSGNKEIVKITARTGTTCTIVRGQESTTPRTFLTSGPTIVSLRLTKGTIERYEAISEFIEGDGTDLEIKSDIIPDTDEAYDIGSATKEVNEIFAKDVTVSGDLSVQTLEVGSIDTTEGTYISAYASSDQTTTGGIGSIIEFDTEQQDTLGEWNSSTFTFVPLYSGHYSVKITVRISGPTDATLYYLFWRNGETAIRRVYHAASGTVSQSVVLTANMYMVASNSYTAFFAPSVAESTCDIMGEYYYSYISIHRVWE